MQYSALFWRLLQMMMWIASLCVCVSWRSVFPSWRTFSLLSAAIPCLPCWIPTREARKRRQARYFVTVLRKILQTTNISVVDLPKGSPALKGAQTYFLIWTLYHGLMISATKAYLFWMKGGSPQIQCILLYILTRSSLRQVDLEKALAIQVDDPIPFMQLLAKNDSGITEVTKQLVLRLYFYDIAWKQIYH